MILPVAVLAAEGGAQLMDPHVDVTDTASLQRGAKLFTNYCMGCHSLKYMRYQRVADDLNIPDDVAQKYLIWDGAKLSDMMTSAMRASDAKQWLGRVPPDLTLVTRYRGPEWVYTYLNTFYRDDSQPTGVNNLLLPGAAMPHVLWRLQGIPEPVHAEETEGGETKVRVVGVKVPKNAGAMTQAQYHEATRDITNFLTYVGEPVRATRQRIGFWVILFLLVFFGVAFMLKREFWKDVH